MANPGLTLSFSSADLTRIRFAVSPLWEAAASVRLLQDGRSSDGLHGRWLEQARQRLRRVDAADVRPFVELVRAYAPLFPGFLSPPPTASVPDLGLELAALAATPPDVVRRGLARPPRRLPPDLVRQWSDPVAGLVALAEAVRVYWSAVLEPYWPRMRAVLRADVAVRARGLVEGGTERLFDDLRPAATWTGGHLRVANPRTRSVELGGRGLLLVPSVFVWPRVYAKVTRPWQPTLRYPARGFADTWASRSGGSAGLAAVVGHSRALLLQQLALPASTKDLAAATGLSPASVSAHLSALYAGALVTRHRMGRSVLYGRSVAAETLLAAQAPP
ncbi:transcriptional regulator [Pilimelia anulata]|uniref:Transcriptional regulator n=1 Tax=Pilimelia anulata TaxID=53371 RepID=A0A8J3BDH5_9ACTN|nr:DUF5937 family protein [Pilimelia anulata]GGJ99042.1 transcriptional regulator [Pilimelia anulata]